MTTSPHKAEILSSSVEAFRKIQHERASLHLANGANSLASECIKCQHMLDSLSKSDGKSDTTVSIKDTSPKSRKHNGSSDLVCGSSTVEMQKVSSGRPSKVNFGQNGHVTSQNLRSPGDFDILKPHSKNGSASCSARKSSREQGSEPEKLIARKDKVLSEGTVQRQPKYVDHLKGMVHFVEMIGKKKHKFMEDLRCLEGEEELGGDTFISNSCLFTYLAFPRTEQEKC